MRCMCLVGTGCAGLATGPIDLATGVLGRGDLGEKRVVVGAAPVETLVHPVDSVLKN